MNVYYITFLSSGKSAETLRFTKRRDFPSSEMFGSMRNGCEGDVTMYLVALVRP